MHRTLLLVALVGCGGKEAAPPATPAPIAAEKPAEAEASPSSPTPSSPKEAKKEPEGPPLVIEKLAVALKGKALDLNWDVSRKGDVPPGTILFVQTVCKVGYTTKTEDETVSGVDVVPMSTARSFKLPAFASVGLPFEPTWCTVSFAYGPKGSSSPTKLSAFCWKKGAVSDGGCS